MTAKQLQQRKLELETKIKQLDAKQLSLKILINSTYGFLCN
jgi:DNA polymerase elongation subunit (family B)